VMMAADGRAVEWSRSAHRRLLPLTLPGHAGELRRMSLDATLMTVAVVAKSFTAISPVTAVFAELPEQLILGPPLPPTATPAALARQQRRQRALRTALLWLAAAAAYHLSVRPNGLALVEAVTGAFCSMLASLGLPCACWVALYRAEVPTAHSLAAVALALAALAGGVAFTAMDIAKLGA